MASLPIAAIMDVAMNPKVQAAVSQIFAKTYSNIFKRNERLSQIDAIDIKPSSLEQKMILDKFAIIERRLSNMPSDTEMAQAFSVLQAELRTGQKRLWYTISVFALTNLVALIFIYVLVRSHSG